jgi:lipid-binding SYLF domain-containing protein
MAALDAQNEARLAAEAAAKAKAQQEGVQTAYTYGISEALFADPTYGAELKAVYELFKAGNTGKALEEGKIDKPSLLDNLFRAMKKLDSAKEFLTRE